MTSDALLTLLPFLIVVALALAIILIDLFLPDRDDLVMAVGIGGLVVALLATLAIGPLPWDMGYFAAPASIGEPALYTRDLMTSLLDLAFISIGLLTLLFAPDYLVPRKLPLPEFAATLLFAISGGMLIAGGQDLLVLFIGLELLVLPGYLLAGFAKRDGLSTEGAIKYFLLGSFSSAILLFGLAFVLGFTGSTQVSGHRRVAGRDRRRQRTAATGAGHGPGHARRSACCSRSPPCPSTTGHPTPTRDLPRRSPATCRSDPRSPRSRSSCGSSWRRWGRCGASGRWWSACWRRSP